MELIIGGAYQGKLDYARKKYSLTDSQIYICSKDSGIEFGARCICGLEAFALHCVKNGEEAADIFEKHREEWADSVLICRDIFCGVVPVDAQIRAAREMTGRLCAYLSREADSVTRIFCGLEQRLK